MPTVYLDCNATTPMDSRVVEGMRPFLEGAFGNAGSRTHDYGAQAKRAVEHARAQVAAVVRARREEVIFTSGATEANNLALLGLMEFGRKSKQMHVVSTLIEHKAVLEPLGAMARNGFEVTLVAPEPDGVVNPEAVANAVREDTLLVSMMHANNETGALQPVAAVATALDRSNAFFHVDAAQSFGKVANILENQRIDLVSASSHKLYGPKGVGALIARRRGFSAPPLRPLMYGGGQERGLRPGTVPVPLVVGFGLACHLALDEQGTRKEACLRFRDVLVRNLEPLAPHFVTPLDRAIHTTASVRVPGLDSEAVMVALKGIVAVSNGSACTSSSYGSSHVLLAMGLSEVEAGQVVRFSWCHETPEPAWERLKRAIQALS